MKVAQAIAVCLFASVAVDSYGAPRSPQITMAGSRLFTESITSTADGSVIIGAMGPGAIFRAKPGAADAVLWIKGHTDGLVNVLGVFADEKADTLWVCSYTDAPQGTRVPQSMLHAFSLSTGNPRQKWPLATPGAMCNDIAVAADGTVYISDTENMEIDVLRPGAKSLKVWAGGGQFGPKGGVLDGIALVSGHVIVNTLETSRLFSVPIQPGGQAGAVTEVKLDRPLDHPDGHRSFGKDSILIVDGGEGGRLMRITLSGANLERGVVQTLQAGFADGPTAVTVVGDSAYVLEAQFATADKPPPRPFKATAVPLTGKR